MKEEWITWKIGLVVFAEKGSENKASIKEWEISMLLAHFDDIAN
jgi:hypothetical protein